MSTEQAVVVRAPTLGERWRLSPSVALRRESFGALAYHFGNRRLTFLKSARLVSVVQGLADQPDVGAALAAAGVPDAQWPVYLEALAGLADGDMIRPIDPSVVGAGGAV